MTPTRSSDSPPPRPAHIWSVEENIAYFRRCAPDSIYNLAQLQSSVVEPKRPSSRSSSVHSSEKESDGAGSDDDNDDDDDEPLNASESTENTDATSNWKDSIATGKYPDTLKTPQPGPNDTTVFCMRFPSSATQEAATGTRRSDIPGSSADAPQNRLARARSTHTTRDSLTEPTRDSEQPPLVTDPLKPETSTDIPPAPTLPQELSPPSSPPARVCEWCCRLALPATDVCIVHKLAEIEEARRDWAITGYKKFREDQLTKTTSERTHLEKALREKLRQQSDHHHHHQQQQQHGTSENSRECHSRSLDAEIRDMQTELRTRDEQIKKWSAEKEQEQKMLWTRLPVPSRKTIVRAHHGKIRVFSGRDPVGGVGFVQKRCGCKEEYLRLSIQQGYV
ncbi:hypothetical protein E4U17_007292 [Claviceps sp. LM77 group G4]|nr:hypothetical protein E4U17_007292 [Claviceps sp. LM77 group G4]KAG6069908.1 hypothetical protein E4U33_004523 [Claviceps sp. LM78 group G4]KAG6070134.1 hypothetical protein E4U16_007127 [Claviceps sp. LM84 group G4]